MQELKAEKKPAGQEVHAAAATLAYFPTSQMRHAEALLGLERPAAHDVQ